MPKSSKKSRDNAKKSQVSDSRFNDFQSDPRFRLPSAKKHKTTLDKRFAHVLKDKDFSATAKVDRYGRKIKPDQKKKALAALYKQESEDEEENEDEDEDDAGATLEDPKRAAAYDPARGGGFSASESDSDDDSDDVDAESDEAEVEDASGMQKFQARQENIPTGEVTNRLAVVNLDWDYIKAVDLMAVFSSFLPVGGAIKRLSVYPSEFGKERMQREETEGPPKAIFRGSKQAESDAEEEDDDDSEVESDSGSLDDDKIKEELLAEGNDQDFDSDALRSYQLDRLRYFYAVIVCSDKAAAQALYEATDGREYQASSNFMDLRFIPDDVEFDDEPRDECTSIPKDYKPVEFVTGALQHSKVQLTWDMHPEEASRKDSIKRAFTGSRKDISENDLKAYLASDESGDEDEAPDEEADANEPKLSKKELARQKMRQALGLGDDPEPSARPSKSGPVGDMQITFAPALSEKAAAAVEPEEETTREKYMRKERERKEKKRQKAKMAREGIDVAEAIESKHKDQATDLGFDDPFFTTESVEKTNAAVRKEERKKKREAREAEEQRKAAEKADLELLMLDDPAEQTTRLDHFDMNEILRAEKKRNKKAKKKGLKSHQDRGGLQEDFEIDVADQRFKAAFDDHEFAIDPTNPKFKATPAMKKLLDEGRRKRKAADDEDAGDGGDAQRKRHVKSSEKNSGRGDELADLVQSVKKKAKRTVT